MQLTPTSVFEPTGGMLSPEREINHALKVLFSLVGCQLIDLAPKKIDAKFKFYLLLGWQKISTSWQRYLNI